MDGGTLVLRAPYAMCGTDITMETGGGLRIRRRRGGIAGSRAPIVLHIRCAMSGTDIGFSLFRTQSAEELGMPLMRFISEQQFHKQVTRAGGHQVSSLLPSDMLGMHSLALTHAEATCALCYFQT
eukprot:1807093-Rhodomonas_salina.2